MANVEFTVELCEALFHAPKTVVSNIEWRASGPETFLFAAKVLCPKEGVVLDLNGYWCHNRFRKERHWGFSLKLGGYCIRSYDMAKRHKNPQNGVVHGPHKHKFKSSKILRFAYKPDPAINDTDPNRSLMDFLTEASVELPTNYQALIFP
jgi:hypothetical protein